MAANAKNKIFPAPITGSHNQKAITTGAAVAINNGATPYAATRAQITSSVAIRFTIDGSAPTASRGFYADINDLVYLQSMEEIAGFRAIAVTANGNLDISYMG